MQAIQTKYLGPTNNRGARIKAWCAAGSKTMDYPYGLNTDLAHYSVAQELMIQLGWTCDALHQGCLPDGSYCHVMVKG